MREHLLRQADARTRHRLILAYQEFAGVLQNGGGTDGVATAEAFEKHMDALPSIMFESAASSPGGASKGNPDRPTVPTRSRGVPRKARSHAQGMISRVGARSAIGEGAGAAPQGDDRAIQRG